MTSYRRGPKCRTLRTPTTLAATAVVTEDQFMSQTPTESTRLKQLKRFIENACRGTMPGRHFFPLCLRASLAKAYGLCVESHINRKSRPAFFLVPSLRSICEDLIVLSFIAKMHKPDRDRLTMLMMTHEVSIRLKTQAAFFASFRPDQPVLGPGDSDPSGMEDLIREIWKQNGWPGLNKAWMPPVSQIAEKNHPEIFKLLYDYIYRLTSGMVHFNPQVLLRSGWGKLPLVKFSPQNFDAYYTDVVRTYSLLLLCLYFELFGKFLRPGIEVRKVVAEIRQDLVRKLRWPEMVTFEEMNLEPPRASSILRILARSASVVTSSGRILNRSRRRSNSPTSVTKTDS
jgi:hypothetical protein